MRTLALAALVAASLVSACGHRGDLERPSRMWGEEPVSDVPREPIEDKTDDPVREDPTEVPSERQDSPQ
jgi:hypothetical protein